jgi:hypothetical protein
MQDGERWPDRLSGWTLPPPGARSGGEVEPVRVFDTAEAALAFLLRLAGRLDQSKPTARSRRVA